MKNIFKTFLVLIIIFSLSLNVLLLHNIKTNSSTCKNNDTDINENEKDTKVVEISKESFARQFKDYQTEAKLADADSVVLWEVTSITEVGYFKSNKNKRLYYVTEKYSCIEGTDCVSASGKIDTDAEYNNTTTFVVAAQPMDESTTIFEILDYAIEKNDDFQKTKAVELK